MKNDQEKKVVFYRVADIQLSAIRVMLSAIISLAIHNISNFDRELQELYQLEEIITDLKDKYEERLNEQ
ncbi:MAG: hypothetical protein HXO49_02235 [Prevotella sp.]|nr:hypothetical protein [Prevotella sp.]